jgi:hypothetical protein
MGAGKSKMGMAGWRDRVFRLIEKMILVWDMEVTRKRKRSIPLCAQDQAPEEKRKVYRSWNQVVLRNIWHQAFKTVNLWEAQRSNLKEKMWELIKTLKTNLFQWFVD